MLWGLRHLGVGLLEESGFLLAVEGIALLTVRALPAEIVLELSAVVVPALETETAVAVRWAFFVADPETAVGFFVVADPETAVGFFVVAPVFVALPVSVCFLYEFG